MQNYQQTLQLRSTNMFVEEILYFKKKKLINEIWKQKNKITLTFIFKRNYSLSIHITFTIDKSNKSMNSSPWVNFSGKGCTLATTTNFFIKEIIGWVLFILWIFIKQSKSLPSHENSLIFEWIAESFSAKANVYP